MSDKIELLIEAGKVLYGERWQTDLARDLGLSDGRRVRQWLSGERPVPPGVLNDIEALLLARRAKMNETLDKIAVVKHDTGSKS
jgi:hypothetical protein